MAGKNRDAGPARTPLQRKAGRMIAVYALFLALFMAFLILLSFAVLKGNGSRDGTAAAVASQREIPPIWRDTDIKGRA